MGDLVFETNTPDCAFPCWQDLVPGQSGIVDYQAMFDNFFGFAGSVDFISVPPAHAPSPTGGRVGGETNVPGIYTSGFHWYVNGDINQNFLVYGWFDYNTDLLLGLIFRWSSMDAAAFRVHMSPERMLRELGSPSSMLVSIDVSENAELASVNLLMIYNIRNVGVGYFMNKRVSVNGGRASLCFGIANFQTDTGPLNMVFVTEPLTSGATGFSSIQARLTGLSEIASRLRPIEEVFDITPEEIAQLVLRQDNACILSRNVLGN